MTLGLLLLLLVSAVWWWHDRAIPRKAAQPADLSATGSLVQVIHAAGMSSDQVALLRTGDELPPGKIELPQGIVELGYPSPT